MPTGIIRTTTAGYVPVCLACHHPLPAALPLRSHALRLLDDHHAHACTAPVPVPR